MRFFKSIWVPYYCIITYAIILSIYGGNYMGENMWWVFIVATIISLIGIVVGLLFEPKRDTSLVSRIDSTTNEIVPTVRTIDENTRKSKDILVEEINPDIKNILTMQSNLKSNLDKIDIVVKEVEFQKRLKEDLSRGLNQGMIQAGLTKVFEKNAQLNIEIKEKEQEIKQLILDNQGLIHTIETLEEEKSSLEERIDSLEKDYSHDVQHCN